MMSEEFFVKLRNLLYFASKDMDAKNSDYLKGIRAGLRMAIRAWYSTYGDEEYKQIELEVFGDNEN